MSELEKIHYNFSYIGTEYLIETIYILIINEKVSGYNLEKEIYPLVAKMYQTTIKNVKNNILNATDKMYYDCEEKILKKYIVYNIKPTPKKIIKFVLENLYL